MPTETSRAPRATTYPRTTGKKTTQIIPMRKPQYRISTMNLDDVLINIIFVLCPAIPFFTSFYPKKAPPLKDHIYPEWKYNIWMLKSMLLGITLGLVIYFSTQSIVHYRGEMPLLIISINIAAYLIPSRNNPYAFPSLKNLPSYLRYEKKLKEIKRQRRVQRKQENHRK